MVVLLILICGNVGLLLFARAASREADLVVRTALGASRGRIVSQMFAEALVLGSVAAIVGVTAADFALRTWGRTRRYSARRAAIASTRVARRAGM